MRNKCITLLLLFFSVCATAQDRMAPKQPIQSYKMAQPGYSNPLKKFKCVGLQCEGFMC